MRFQNSNANISKFKVQVDFDTNRKATGTVFFPESDGSLTEPLTKDRKYWSQPLKDALQMHQDGGFPFQLTLIYNPIKPIPAVAFYEKNTAIHMTLKMTSAQVVETSVIVNNNSSFQNYTNPDDHTQQTTDTPGFKPFTVLRSFGRQSEQLANNFISYASTVRRIRQQLWFNHRLDLSPR